MVRFTYSRHAKNALEERDLPQSWVERTVTAPDTVEQDPHHSGRLLAFARVPERDGRVLRVVYVPDEDGVRIITAFLDRARR